MASSRSAIRFFEAPIEELLAAPEAVEGVRDNPKVASYLQEADSAVRRLGRDANHLWTAFGPTNVAIHRVNTAAELGDTLTVLNFGRSLNTRAVPVERRVRHLLDVARAYSVLGQNEGAIRLDDAEIDQTEWVALANLSRYVIPRLERRLTNAYHAYMSGTILYLEHGEPRA